MGENKKLLGKKIGISILISIVISLMLETIIFRGELFKEIYAQSNSISFEYNMNEFIANGYEVNTNEYKTIHDDPWFLKENIEEYVKNVSINFLEPLAQDLGVAVYYAGSNEPLQEKNSIHKTVAAGEQELNIPLKKQISTIRIDIGNKQGQKFTIDKVSFNSTSNMKIDDVVWYTTRALIMFILCFGVSLIMLIFKGSLPLEKYFVIFGLMLGIGYMLIMPINQIPDEHAHFETVYRYSNKILRIEDTVDTSTSYMRECDAYFHNIGSKASSDLYNESIDILMNDHNDDLVEVGMRDVNNFFIVYLPAAITISIARILSVNPIILYMLGRLTNLIIYIILGYWALKKIPIIKSAFFVVLMFPMVLHQAASYSADSILNSICFLFISYVLYILYEDKIEKKDIYIGIALAALIAPSKVVYFPMLGMILFIIKDKYKNTSKHRRILLVCIGVCIMTMLVQNMQIFKNIIFPPVNSNGSAEKILYDGTIGYSIKYVIKYPLQTIQVFLKTLEVNGNWYINTMIGSSLGWLNININLLLIFLFKILFIGACLNNKDAKDEITYFNWKQKSFILILIMSVIALIELALFVSWTHLGNPVIEGIQGRYFIPLLPLVAILFRNQNLKFEKNMNTFIVYSAVILQAAVLVNLFNNIIHA